MNTIKCLAKLGVFKKSGDREREILALATEFKEALAESHWREHRAEIDFSYELLPDLFPAKVEANRLGCLVAECEQSMNEDSSKRKALREKLKQLKAERTAAWGKVSSIRKKFFAVKTAFKKAKSDFKVWKDVKTLETRVPEYEAVLRSLQGPVKQYGELWVSFDLERRRIGELFQSLGLHSDIRTEIAKSVKPKLAGKDGPGTVYQYGRKPEVEPVRKLTIQLKDGGKTFDELLAGEEPQLRIEQVGERIYSVRQVIGNSEKPCVLTYEMKVHRAFPKDAVVKRWSLCCDERGKRYVTPIIQANHSKATGKGYVAYDLGFRKRGDGIRVAYFLGDNIHEELVLPGWLVNRFRQVYSMQSEMDLKANTFLSKRGVEPGKRNPIKLIEKMAETATDTAAQNFMDEYWLYMDRRLKLWHSAIRARQNIYEHAVERVRRRHSHIIIDSIDIKDLKMRKTAEETERELPQMVRQNLHIAAIGSLSAMLKRSQLVPLTVKINHSSCTCPHCGYENKKPSSALIQRCEDCKESWDRDYGACVEMLTRADVPRQKAIHSRKTNVIGTYVESLAISGASPRGYKDDLSQDGFLDEAA